MLTKMFFEVLIIHLEIAISLSHLLKDAIMEQDRALCWIIKTYFMISS